VSGSRLVHLALRLLVAVGVLLCLTGVAGHSPAETAEATSAHAVAAHHAGHLMADHAPAMPEHHGGSDAHAHGCMTSMPGQDAGGAVALALPIGKVAPAAAPGTSAVVERDVSAPSRTPSDLDVLCVRRM
jgi:hypothetical protein